MKYQWFRFPVSADHDLEELNQFLGSHRVISVRNDWVQGPQGAVLVFLVEYADATASGGKRSAGRKTEAATRNLDPRELATFNRLRDVRKELAAEAGVPVWSLFGNDALRTVVKERPATVEKLAAVAGFGKTRATKYGTKVLGVLKDMLDDAPASGSTAGLAVGAIDGGGNEVETREAGVAPKRASETRPGDTKADESGAGADPQNEALADTNWTEEP